MFTHINYKTIPEIRQINSEGVRLYETPNGAKYPSVTTVLSHLKKDSIEEWKARVGAEEAQKVMTKAARRGTRVHTMCEDFLNNRFEALRYMPMDIELFNSVKPILQNNINNIYCQEQRMWSDHLKLAGTVDCIAEYDGTLSIIDFKTSAKTKPREWITNYFMQEAAYAIMFEERTGKPIKQLVTIIAVDYEEPQVFIEDRDDWAGELLAAIQSYNNRWL